MRWLLTLLASLAFAGCVSVSDAPSPATDKRIAITFDDIPREPGAFLDRDERAAMLIDGLAAAGVEQAAFFLNPGRIDDHPRAEAEIAAYVAAGHVIANHSATHPRLSETDTTAYLADIDAAERWLAGRPGYRPWFRFPYLDEGQRDMAKRDALRAALRERGLANGYVTVDASDWWLEGAAKEARNSGKAIDRDALRDLYVESHVEAAEFYDRLARRTWGRSPAHVLLLHETDIAAMWIDDLIAALRDSGWTIVTADEAFADPISGLAPDTPFAQGTLTEAAAWEKGLPAPRWYERNDTRVYEKLFAERVVLTRDPQEGPS